MKTLHFDILISMATRQNTDDVFIELGRVLGLMRMGLGTHLSVRKESKKDQVEFIRKQKEAKKNSKKV